MRIKIATLACLLLGVTAWLPSAPVAHCPGEVPKITLSYPRDGVAIETFCFEFLGGCVTDTFHREDLHKELVDNFNKSKHVVFAFADSLVNFLDRDTVVIGADVYYDTIQMESLWVSVDSHLKGILPRQKFVFRDQFDNYVRENRFATTYTELIDTPFVAFFDTYEDVRSWGIGPKDGCFFEPDAYMLIGGRIHKRNGWDGNRMPGVSVAVTDFLKAVGLPNAPVPVARPRLPGGIRSRDPRLSQSMITRANRVQVHDLQGKRLGGISTRSPDAGTAALGPLPVGWYMLQWQGPGWSKTQPLFFPGGQDFAAFLGLLRVHPAP